MEKFIPYEKLSKKEKRRIDQARRQTWGELNPVTRKPVSSKAYNRKKSQAWKRDVPPVACDFFFSFADISGDDANALYNSPSDLAGAFPEQKQVHPGYATTPDFLRLDEYRR